MIDKVTGLAYVGMSGRTIQSEKRAIAKLKGRKGWVEDANQGGKVIHVEGFGISAQLGGLV